MVLVMRESGNHPPTRLRQTACKQWSLSEKLCPQDFSSLTSQLQHDRMIINPLAFLDEFVLSADESICPKQERTAHADT